MKRIAVLCAVLLCLANAQSDIINQVLSAMNTSVDPCYDFYEYACGNWLANTHLPPDESRYDRSFSTIEASNQAFLLNILQDPNTNAKLTTFYSQCMDTTTIDSLGAEPVLPYLQLVEAVEDIETLMLYTGLLHAHGISNILFNLYVTIDAGNPALTIAGFGQGGLGLPYQSLYTDSSNSSATIRAEYLVHISNMFQLVGVDPDSAAALANTVLQFETMIAQFTLPDDALVDPFTTYNKLNVSGLIEIAPNIPWEVYLGGLDRSFEQATIDVPSYFSNLSAIITNTQSYWVPYLQWQILHHFAPRLSSAFVNENFRFYGSILNGAQEISPRWKRCIGATDGALGELLGSYFIKAAFPGQSKQAALAILSGIVGAMKSDLQNLTWMDNTTRKRALLKLSQVTDMIGGPQNPKNYSNVDVGDGHFENAINADIAAMNDQLDQIERPSDKMQWGMTPPTVNAYYDPTRNQMVFPAGILQQPFFNLSYPYPMNAGAIGMVMGHELTHGFDNQGRDYDGQGKLVNWWLPQTSAKFDQKVQCVIDQYSKFEVLPGVFVNGKLTQGENIADMGGIKNSFRNFLNNMGGQANQPSIVPGLSNAQLFFVAFGQGWCEKVTDEYLRVQVQTDPHSPARFRVLGPLRNLPNFADTFQCAQGTPMNPINRCQVW